MQENKNQVAASYPKISVVVVNYNLAGYLEDALRSIVDQNYPNLELIVVDGGSTDGSQAVIERFADKIHWWVSEPDKGQYDAVQKGFSHSTGEIMYWLNSDDMLQRRALFVVAEVFQTFPEIEWLTGIASEYHPDGHIVQRITLPWSRWSRLRYLTYDFQFIQQESTFWRRSLWEKAGATMSTELKLAGDMELWARFFRHAKLYTVQSLLGGFRYRREGQRSRDQRLQYLAECRLVAKRERQNLGILARIGLSALRPVGLGLGIWFFYDVPIIRLLYLGIFNLPPVISYDFNQMRYRKKRIQVKHPPVFLGGRTVSLRK
ncbi:MAG: glycosyltransferase [Bacteroidetes bacterium]|nr:glycosyltransferase [Bacteroidota bacterium]